MNPVGQIVHDLVPHAAPARDALLVLGKIALLSLACGIGPFLTLVPARIRNAFLGVALLWTLGIGMVLVASVYCVALGFPVGRAVPAALFVSLAFLAAGMARPSALAARVRLALAAVVRWKYQLALGAFVPLLVVAPGFWKGLTQPHRVGVDEMGYAITGQYLLEGGSLKALKSEIIAQTGKPGLEAALAANGESLNVNANIASEFLFKSLRWYPAGTAAILSTLGERYVLPFQFLLLYFPLVLLFGVAHHFLRTLADLPEWAAILGAAAVLLNVNLLNVLCEGQHAQVFGSPFFFLLFGQLFFFRRSCTSAVAESGAPSEILFTGLLSAIVLCAFPELLFLSAVLAGLVCCLDLVIYRKVLDRGVLLFGLAVAAGFALGGPYASRWPAFLLSHLRHLQTGGGFWQPQWAFPAEILGLFDIYRPAAPEYIGRDIAGGALVLGISLLCVEVVVLRPIAGGKWDASYWLAPVLFVAAVFAKVYFVNKLHNYQYMKAYTLVMVPLLALFFGAFGHVARVAGWPRVLLAGCMVWVLGQGLSYVKRYTQEATFTPYSPARTKALKSCVRWDDYVWVMTSGGIDKLGCASLVRLNWLNLAWDIPYLIPHMGKRVGIWCDRKDLAEAVPAKGVSVLYEDEVRILFDSGVTLGNDSLVDGCMAPIPAGGSPKARWIASCAAFLQTHGF